MTTKHRLRTARVATTLAAAAALAGCGQDIQDQYRIQIVGPIGVDYLAGARRVVLDVGGREVASTNIMPGVPFSLTGTGVAVSATSTGSVRVRALDEAGTVVAVGQSPDVELVLQDRQLIVFIQKPGTFGRSKNLETPRSRHVSAAALAVPTISGQAASVGVGLFGMGRVRVTDAMTRMPREQPSDTFYIYNPLIHESEFIGESAAISGVRQPRYDVGFAFRPDNQNLVIFGGIGPLMPGGPEVAQAVLEIFRLRRIDFDVFQLTRGDPRVTTNAGIHRSAPALAVATQSYAFGGRGEDGMPLDTVVALDPTAANDAMVLLDKKMAAPRVGHTATAVAVGGNPPEVLVVGGAPAGSPVAEVFQPSMGFMLPAGDAGPARRDHAVALVPDNGSVLAGNVLIVGGVAADGSAPLGDIRRYAPNMRRIEPAPVSLATPRTGCAAFVVGDDLVVVGGADAAGNPVANAEVFSISQNLQPRGVVPALARVRPAVTVLPNNSALVVGGEEMGNVSSAAVEIYQPNVAR